MVGKRIVFNSVCQQFVTYFLAQHNSVTQPIFFFYKIAWSFNFLTKNREQCPAASWGKPSVSYSEYISQLHDKFGAAGRLRWSPASAALRASSVQSEQPQQKPVEHQSKNFHRASHHHQRREKTTQCSQGTSTDLLSWMGKWEKRSLLQQATEVTEGQLPFGDPLCSEPDKRDPFSQLLPGCPACLWEPVDCYVNIVYFINFLLPSIDK